MKKVLLVAYETRYAQCGGIAAVMDQLPGYLRSAAGLTVSVITPFHHRIPNTMSLPVRPVGTVNVPFCADIVSVKVSRFDDRWHWYFLDAQDYILPAVCRVTPDDERFFAGVRQPYNVGTNASSQLAILRRDSLFFGAAVARALQQFGPDIQWTMLLQDWQAATAALALTGSNANRNVRCFLTLHNSYDSGEMNADELCRVGIDPVHVSAPSHRHTVLGRAIPLLARPIFTVSEQFARDFVNDKFQSDVMANHLQDDLRFPSLVGVNNGLFTSLQIPEPVLAAARRFDYAPIKAWKTEQKTAAIDALSRFVPEEEKPVWGDKAAFVKAGDDLPWFVFAGRDDTRQKGYDVASEAVRSFLEKPGNEAKAQFLFFPIPGDEGRDGLIFLRRLAQKHKANVLALPFMFQEGYMAALRGAAFGVMPSLYEPFGMAGNFYLSGALGIGRATGGLLQQIVPLRSIPSCTTDVVERSNRWHSLSAPATGFLYRERDDYPEYVDNWQAFNDVAYLAQPGGDRVTERSTYSLFKDMVAALESAFHDALAVYHKPSSKPNGKEDYYVMLLDGIGHLQRGFSWEWSAAEYNSYLV